MKKTKTFSIYSKPEAKMLVPFVIEQLHNITSTANSTNYYNSQENNIQESNDYFVVDLKYFWDSDFG